MRCRRRSRHCSRPGSSGSRARSARFWSAARSKGRCFTARLSRALSGERTETEVDLQLAGLVRKELIRPHPATIQGEDAFRFRHLLIRDAAYDSLPKARRADLHERFARWLEQQAVGDIVELDEIAGWHLEQTLRYRRELGQEPGRGSFG